MEDKSSPNSANTVGTLDKLIKFVQTISIVAGVVISVLTLSQAIKKDADARKTEAEERMLELEQFKHQRRMDEITKAREAALPFLKLRMEKYLDAVKVAGVLADPKRHTKNEYRAAEKRFWELYWAELSMVETHGVEAKMVNIKDQIAPGQVNTEVQDAVLQLARAIRESTARSWGIAELESPFEASSESN